MENIFKNLGITECFIEGLEKEGITVPTEIQEKVIPIAMQNKDIIGRSETGTGKTLAYVLPIIERIDASKKEMQALILAPTHELVIQINSEIQKLSKNSNSAVRSTPIIGDGNINRQVDKLKEKPHIIVGSADRVLELIKKRKISAHTIKTIVLDEADRMLDGRNLENAKAVIKTTLRDRQLLLFSATMPLPIMNVAKEMMKSPEYINVETKDKVNENIEHFFFICDRRDKIDMIRKFVNAVKPERTIIFVNKGADIDFVTDRLKHYKVKAAGIKANSSKEERKGALNDFKLGKIQILVSTDVAARGLDIKGITHIINLDIPFNNKDYLHRVGRTARANNTGTAISIVTMGELKFLDKLEEAYNIEFKEKDIYRGELVDIVYEKQ